MLAPMPNDPITTADPQAHAGPRYAIIERHLGRAIAEGRLQAGTVITEEPVARLFGTSRTPVRTALTELEKRALLERFEGRGFVVPGADAPLRVPLTEAMLGLTETAPAEPKIAADRIARDFEVALAQALPFGIYHVNEQAAAHHFGVSRTVVRELLSLFQDRGLVAKDNRSHWVLGPLTAEDVQHHFAIRERLEPLALIESAQALPSEEIAAMLARSRAAVAQGEALPVADLAALETDLHETLLRRTSNPHLRRYIRQSQGALTVNQIFAEAVGTGPFIGALEEHCIVLEFLIRGSWEAAGRALEEHLRLSAVRTRARLKSLSVFPVPVIPDFLRPRPV